MTISESYRDYQNGKINKAQFMERARKDSHLKKLVTNVMTFDDTVKVLKNKGIISEAAKPVYEIIPGELRKGINYELGLTYQAVPDWDSTFIDRSELDKATKKVVKNLEKDSLYYTKLIGQGEEPKQEAPTADVEFKEGKVQKTDGKIKADGSLKKEVKKDEKSNVQTTLSKKEKKKGKPEGVKQLKEGLESEFGEMSPLGTLLSRVAEDWGKEDLYSDLIDTIVASMDDNGNLSPKGMARVKAILTNYDVIEDYGPILDGPEPIDHMGDITSMEEDTAGAEEEKMMDFLAQEDIVREAAYVPDNIKSFAKRKGISSLVNKVAGWAEKAGKGIKGGTAIGKNYDTLILDLSYQDGAIRINIPEEEIEVYDEPVYDYPSFLAAVQQSSSQEDLEEGFKFLKGKSREEVKEMVKKQVLKELEKVVVKNTGEVIKLANDTSTAKKFVQSQSPQVASQLKVTGS